MTHHLRRPCAENPIKSPLAATLRYRCECANNEVLSVSAVFDMNVTEEQFIWTMRNMWRDVKFEVQQHIERPQKDTPHVRA